MEMKIVEPVEEGYYNTPGVCHPLSSGFEL
jgi:hypothetical protein